MRKIILTTLLSFAGLVIFAQTSEVPQRLKYVTNAPDGSVAMTIIDDSREDSMKLESANVFYKYQIIDTYTGEPLFTTENKGKACEIDKTKIKAGTYNLRLYTSNFVITSKITVSGSRKLQNTISEESIVMND